MQSFKFPFYSFQVQPREVDLTKRATIISLGDSILHSAGEDADRIGFGIRTLQQHNSTWVLYRMAIEVDYFPEEYEHYSIGTWVYEINRMMTIRNFILLSDTGRQFAAASTCWTMIDMESRQPLDLRNNPAYAAARIDHPFAMEHPVKIARINGAPVDTHQVRYSDIDFNQHANTMKYIQWMIDNLPLTHLTQRNLHRLDLNFIHETRYGQHVQILHEPGEQTDRFEILRLTDNQTACKAVFSWK